MADNPTVALTRALVGENVGLYAASANFKTAIDLLVRMLPPMVQGLADEATDKDAQFAATYERLRNMPSLPNGEPF